MRRMPGMLITDSRGVLDAASKSDSPRVGLRSARSGEEPRAVEDNNSRYNVSLLWVNGLAMLSDSLATAGHPARHVMREFL